MKGLTHYLQSCSHFELLHTHGSGSQVAPKEAIYVKSPTAAPFAAVGVPGIKHENVRTIDRPWPTVPQRKSFRLPALSMMNQLTVAKME